ncbi:hypothetical protein AB0B12_05995 [Streptomyces sp. NPDC044780]|uniref:hypothetical protein n=1 Tax=unclassified Streptomyces TaxID=2593676 RepID=UPI0033E9A801
MSSSTVRTARRRTLRVAAAALIAAAGLSLTACSGSDDTSSKSAATAASSSAGSSAGAQGSDAKVDTKAGAADKAASPSRTETLADGSTAEIYELGDLHYRLKIVNDGDVLATLEANEHDAGLDANDMFVVLTAGGEVHSWMGGGQQGPGTFKLAGGWTAKVTKIGELQYRAQIIGHDGVAATMETNEHDTGLDANGVYIVLSAGGVISAHE